MKFTTPCFVRVEDAEKRKELIGWLAKIGYSRTYLILNDNLDCIVTGGDAALSTNMEQFDFWITSVPYVGRIDCGNNIELFKALAARNDTNARNQWLIDPCGVWYFDPSDTTDLRKATVEEIIEHFKNK